ncbi:hypothetical protein HNQ50_001431 [Silvimonas terrae]|uniref:Uncharacterized protein n=1 Tax=Silvimonas terrae TaxID=300266 RepID=A0A840RBA3_9NEIS|nr:hypothetical protein [Silvimonas terrae]MBB5190709.1 hypothetical protein [Silvimonas terrae]
MVFLTAMKNKYVWYGAGGLLLLLWLKAQASGKSMVTEAAITIGGAVADVAVATGQDLYDAAKPIVEYPLAAARSAAQTEFIGDVWGVAGVIPQGPVEEAIILDYMPTGQLVMDGLPLLGTYVGVKAMLAGRAVHQYRQAVGIEPKDPPGFLSKLF